MIFVNNLIKKGGITMKNFILRLQQARFIKAFRSLQKDVYDNAQAHGFHELENNELHVPTKLALIGSEVSEALEAHRKRKDTEIPHELADIIIRVLDLAESLGIDLATEIIEKHKINVTREFKHGNKRY